MSLTLSDGPLSERRGDRVNYRIDGPENLLFANTFPRSVRAVVAGETVLDTTDGMLLHESGLLPQLYVPEADLRADCLRPSDHTTACPFKGIATYRTLQLGDRIETNAVWDYRTPPSEASWLQGYVALRWDAVDSWFDEAEEVLGHLRDPYHRVDVCRTARRIEVYLRGQLIARSSAAVVLSETGLSNRYYLPPDQVRGDVLHSSPTETICPYKGTASYLSGQVGSKIVDDVAWRYRKPLAEMTVITEKLSFSHPLIEVFADDELVDS